MCSKMLQKVSIIFTLSNLFLITSGSNYRKQSLQYKKLLQRTTGSVRLVGGSNMNEGNVEIFFRGIWGSLCDDEWDINEGLVVCRQLGFHAAEEITTSSKYGPSNGIFWMKDLFCDGTEKKLSNCRFEHWDNLECRSTEVAGVKCTNSSTSSKNIKKKTHDETQEENSMMKIRLRGGRSRMEGRVEVKLDSTGWGTICPDSWSIIEANVVCKHLNFGYASDALQSDFFGGSNISKIILSSSKCHGNESDFKFCDYQKLGDEVKCNNEANQVASVMCTYELPDLVFDISELEQSLHLEDRMLYFLQCAMEENCLASEAYTIKKDNSGWPIESRRLLKFTAKTYNGGNADFRPHIPKHMWEWHQCHMHYHSMEVFANFNIYDQNGVKVAEGHKASFCLEDNQCDPNVKAKYACANYGDQGISVGCYDIYRYNIDCQWIDITELDFGMYTMKIEINPDFKVSEMNYDNNGARCTLVYSPTNAFVRSCILERPNIKI